MDSKERVGTLKSSITEIQTVQIPKYDKAVALSTEVRAEQMQPIPVLTNEVDWLVVLNELSRIQPANTVDAGISLEATPPLAAASPTTSAGTTPKSAITLPTATETIGTLSTTVTVPNLPSVTAWGQAMNSGVVLTNVLPSGALTPAFGCHLPGHHEH